MKTNRSQKVISVLLALLMVFGLLPLSAIPTFAATTTVTTHDVDQIRDLLRGVGDVVINLDADAEKDLDFYFDKNEYETNKVDNRVIWATVGSGNKTLNLNGHRLYINDKTYEWGAGIWQAALMDIPSGASLTVNDNVGTGKIWMDTPMYFDIWYEGNGGLKIRDIFFVTGGNLTINGGEIHAGRAKRVYANYVSKEDKNWQWPGADWYEEWYANRNETPEDIGYPWYWGYATKFNSGTAITAYYGTVTVNGGEIWGRGWDNFTLISRVPNNPNGADDHRDRCAALRALGSSRVTINGGSFYGRSDADAVQVSDPNNLTVKAGTFDVSTNDYLTYPALFQYTTRFLGSDCFNVIVGYLGSPVIPTQCIDQQSTALLDEKTMVVFPIGQNKTPYTIIGDIGLNINSPMAYETPSVNANQVYNLPDGCRVESITWYKNGKIVENADSTYFEEGASYYVKIGMVADSNAKFKYSLSEASVNGLDAEVYRKDDRHVVLTARFGTCIAALESIGLEAIEPKADCSPNYWVSVNDDSLYEARGSYGNYTDYRKWYVSDNGTSGWTEMDPNDLFTAGKYYRFSCDVIAGEGQEFAVKDTGSIQPNITAKVNGKKATVAKVYDQDPVRYVTVTVDFGKCPATVGVIALATNYEPKEGETVNYTLSAVGDGYYVIGQGTSNSDTYVQWYVSDTGAADTWTKLNKGAKFQAGKYYRLYADVHTSGGYTFDTWDNGTSVLPYVSATVNGYYADVIKTQEQEPSQCATVVFDFGMCNDSVIENIQVVDVTAPVAGEKPSYTYNILGSGYQMDLAHNAYTEAYWLTPSQNLYYVKNGIGWWDTTSGSWDYVYENDTFIPGHTYACQLYLVTEDGYHFTNKTEHDALPTVTVNGLAGEVNEGWTNATEARVFCTFTCAQQAVSTVEISDIDFPQGGKAPDYTVTLGRPDLYTVDTKYGVNNSGIYWYDSEDNLLTAGDTFRAGERYKVEIKLTSAKLDDAAVSRFANPATAYINGEQVTERFDWDKVFANNTYVYVYYTFARGAAAPEVEQEANHVHSLTLVPAQAATCTKSGNEAYYICSVCHNWFRDAAGNTPIADKSSVILPTTNHKYDGGTVTTEPTCTSMGVKTYVCTVCGQTKTEDVPVSAHQYDADGVCANCYDWKYKTSAPKLVSVTNAKGGITVKWNALTGAEGYMVYRKTASSGWSLIASGMSATSYTDTKAAAGTQYIYTVKAYRGGTNSKYDAKGLTLVRLTNPAVKVANAKDGANVTWAKVTGAKGYYVYRKTGSGAYSKIATTTALSYVDKTAKSGTTYTYAVRAYNGSVLSAFNAVSVIRLANPAVKVANAAAGANVTWAKITGAKGYYVYRKTGSGSYSKIATTTALSYVDKTAKAGTTYTYTVRAYNGSTLSAYAGVGIVRLTTPSVKLANTKTGPKATWSKVAGAKGYYVYRKTANGSYSRIGVIKSGATVSYVDKTAKSGVKYYYAVKAYNGSYTSAYTNTAITCKK